MLHNRLHFSEASVSYRSWYSDNYNVRVYFHYRHEYWFQALSLWNWFRGVFRLPSNCYSWYVIWVGNCFLSFITTNPTKHFYVFSSIWLDNLYSLIFYLYCGYRRHFLCLDLLAKTSHLIKLVLCWCENGRFSYLTHRNQLSFLSF